MRSVLAAALGVAAAVALAGPAGAAARECRGADLAGRFAVVPHSAGAGQISYRLVLRNRSRSACVVHGLPAVRLLGRRGKALPTRVQAAFPSRLASVRVVLAPGRSARADARFSPDVPGVGEQHPGRCERVAYRLRVHARGGGSTLVPVAPPTPVCERGRLVFTAYRAG